MAKLLKGAGLETIDSLAPARLTGLRVLRKVPTSTNGCPRTGGWETGRTGAETTQLQG